MEFRVVIPARFNSGRLPGKPLLEINGKPMVQHVYERAIESGAESVVIATDDERIRKAAEGFGAQVCMTSPDHTSGTERLAEAVVALGYLEDEVIVNLQGDEPMIPPVLISQVAEDLVKFENARVATLYEPIETVQNLFDPRIVKVVMSKRGYALYFSRAPIAWDRKNFQIPPDENQPLQTKHFRHIGVYAYHVRFLEEYMAWDKSELEEMEQLEQLRVLWNGGRVHLTRALEAMPPDVNTEQDLENVRALLSGNSGSS
ncbi:MAG: kdsB [Gammaproteobacteria bacterium]|jgi:3-deoxy-manno-octulosonate cytidylyltransferase (CMP-KDO synthetase)|nr:kdsB [Gammaproteobacteria bacterium]